MNSPDEQYPHKTWDIPDPELMKLFDLSQNLPLDGEITPIIALQIVRNHERFGELSLQDFEALKENLRGKSRCYGYVIAIYLANLPLLPIYALPAPHDTNSVNKQ